MAPVQLFPHLHEEVPPKWAIGKKLEADLPEGEGDGVTVATVRDIIGRRILVHLDFYKTDFWVEVNSPVIHPIDWHAQVLQSFNSPSKDFNWPAYLRQARAKKIPEEVFAARDPIAFRPGMKVEVVDPKSPSLVRPATVVHVLGFRIRVLFDNWPPQYAFWMADDSPDVHPVGWAKLTGHPLEATAGPPKTPVCSVVAGCRGVGNARNKSRPYHRKPEECPYFLTNWQQQEASDRLQVVRAAKKPPAIKQGGVKPEPRTDQELESSEPDENGKVVSRRRYSGQEVIYQRQVLVEFNTKRLPPLEDVMAVYEWTPHQVADFVAKIPGCKVWAAQFERELIDGAAFATLTKDDLESYLGLKMGPAVKIYNRILKMRELVLKTLVKLD